MSRTRWRTTERSGMDGGEAASGRGEAAGRETRSSTVNDPGPRIGTIEQCRPSPVLGASLNIKRIQLRSGPAIGNCLQVRPLPGAQFSAHLNPRRGATLRPGCAAADDGTRVRSPSERRVAPTRRHPGSPRRRALSRRSLLLLAPRGTSFRRIGAPRGLV